MFQLKLDDFKDFKADSFNVPGREIKFKIFHGFSHKDVLLESNLRKAPKLTKKAPHRGNLKQNFPTSLLMFHETTDTSIQTHFPNESSIVEFLELFSKWWVILNLNHHF